MSILDLLFLNFPTVGLSLIVLPTAVWFWLTRAL